jgi:hypothetical protein
VRAALDAAQSTIERLGLQGSTHLIPRLAQEVWSMLEMDAAPPSRNPGPPEMPSKQLVLTETPASVPETQLPANDAVGKGAQAETRKEAPKDGGLTSDVQDLPLDIPSAVDVGAPDEGMKEKPKRRPRSSKSDQSAPKHDA